MKQMITNKQRTMIFLNIMISCIASAMLATALTTALPIMSVDLKISVTTAQWLTSGYSLAMGIMMPLTAFLITRFPTKKLYLTAIALFIAGLFVCIVSTNFTTLMIGRILQASGNGILSSMAQVILLSIYPLEKRGSIMGWYGLTIGAAPVIAPTIAGVIVDTSGWRTIFIGSAIIMLVSFIFAYFVFDNVLENQKQKFDMTSFILSGLAFGGITLGIGNIGQASLMDFQVLIPLAIGIITSLVFVRRQLHLSQPFLDLRVLKNRNFGISLISSMMLYFIMMGSSIIMPIYVQTMLGFSATVSGLVTLPGSLAMTIISPFTGKIYDRFGMKLLFILGSVCLLLSNFGMYFVTLSSSILIAMGLNILRSLAIGCLMMPLVTWGMSGLKTHEIAHGTALLTALRTISGAIGTAVFVSIMSAVAKHSLTDYGANAQIHGMNITFLFMSAIAVILIAVAVFSNKTDNTTRFTQEKKPNNVEA